MRFAARAVRHVVTLALAGVDPLPLEDVASGSAGAALFGREDGLTLVFADSMPPNFPSRNWIAGKPFGPGSALGIAVMPAGRAVRRARVHLHRRRERAPADLPRSADERETFFGLRPL